MITCYVGSNESYLSDIATAACPNAKLLLPNNIDDIVDGGVYYISLADFVDIELFNNALSFMDIIYYCPPSEWEYSKKENLEKKWTEYSLCYFADKKKIFGIEHFSQSNIPDMLKLVDDRKTDGRQIWNAGCSITHGVGVRDNEKYGALIAEHFDLPISYLSAAGSSIEWAADQILRSDIRENDLVIWGLTSICRLAWYNSKTLYHVNAHTYEYNPFLLEIISPDRLDDDDRLYKALTAIWRVINFCKKVNCKLVLAGILIDSLYVKNFLQMPDYIHLHGYYGYRDFRGSTVSSIDIGDDIDMHPGKLMHQYYANNIINKITDNPNWKIKI